MTLPITYKTPTLSATSSGGVKVSYVNGQTDFAEIKAAREQNINIGDQTQQVSELVFKIQYRESLLINDKWLITFEGKDYKINAIERKDLDRRYYSVKATALK